MAVSAVLGAELDEIVAEWAQAAQRELPEAANVPPLALLDHMPNLLIALATWLERDGDSEAYEEWKSDVHRHAVDRLDRDFDLRQVVREYQLLRRVLTHRLEGANRADSATAILARMTDAVDLMVGEAVSRYSAARDQRFLAEAARSKLALQAAALGTWEWIAGGGELRWDARTRQLFGLAEGPTTYAAFFAALHPDDRARVQAAFDEKVASPRAGDDYRIEYRVIGVSDGIERWIESRGCVLSRGVQGRAERFIGTVLDVTERKRTEHDLAQTAEFRERFVGIVSHDLRNPLSAIRMAATLLVTSEHLPPSLGRTAGRILSNADRMGRMIGDLLDLTRGRLGGGIPIERRSTDLREIAPAVLEDLELAHPGRAIVREMRGRLDGEWDADRITQALGNLVANAFEHGEETAPVRVTLVDDGDRVALAVHNEGPPIPVEQQAHLFDPFRRARQRGRGLGLGLFIACEVARAHGGSITVSSSEGEGTTFRLTLPRRSASPRRGQRP